MSVGEALDKEERPAYIQFETRAVENKKESLKQGHYVGTDVDFVMVTLPGGRDVYESKVDSWFENKERQTKNGRVDPEHLKYYRRAYAAFKEGQSIPVDGTPIKGWGAVSPAQEKTVIMAGIRTIEDLAASNDEALRRLGMGGRDIVNKAKSWLKSAGDHGKVALENAELIKQNKILTTTVESLEEKVELLARKVETMDVPRGTTDSDMLPEPGRLMSEEESLASRYELKFGKKPHHLMKEATIRKKLEE